MSDSFVQTAREVIEIERDGLTALVSGIDESFAKAAQMILSAPGRVIVSGMGKSGHIARKIAATLASTGTPAFFVHPAEASHGDMGMLAKGDIALLLSNSGDTPELANMIAHTRRFEIPLIGVASRTESSLAQHADVVLQLPRSPEACGMNVVPTTSTTMTLALGDALAVALMRHRAFTPAMFRQFHPGGKLGAQLSRVSDLMHSGQDLPLAHVGTPMTEALLTMSQKGFGVVGIAGQGGELLGLITDGDLRRNMDGLLDRTVEQVMTASPRTIHADALAEEAVAMMTLHKPQITCLFVTQTPDDSQIAGLIHIHDCLRAGLG